MMTLSEAEPLDGSPAPGGDGVPVAPAQRRAILAAVLIANFLAALEATVVTTAMPTVIAALGGLERYSWVFTAYMLTSTVTMPLWGKLSDVFGRRRLMLLALGLFLVGSGLSGVAQSFSQLVAFRALQGLGAGGVAPLGMTIIGELYSASERARMQGVFASVWGFASIAGPLLGGLLTDHLSWRWVFFINLPIGLVAVVMIQRRLPRLGRQREGRLDIAGAIVLSACVTLMLLACARIGESQGRIDVYGGGLTLLAALTLAAFVFVERAAEDPIVPLGMLRQRLVRVPYACGLLAGMGMFSGMTFIPMFVQGVTGSTATQAGLTLTPFLLAWVLTSTVAGPMALRFPIRALASTGFLLVLAGFVILSQFDATTPRATIYFDVTLMGMGMGMAMLVMLLLIQTVVRRENLGVATSLQVFFRSVGGAIGVAALGAVLTATFLTSLAGETLAASADVNAVLDPVRRRALPAGDLLLLEGALATSLHRVFVAGTVVAAMAFVVSLRLPWRTILDIERDHR